MSDIEQTTDDLEEVNPWTDIWIRPRQTIDWIVENNSGLLTTIILIYLGGVHFGIAQAELNDYGDRKEVLDILKSSILISGLGGLITYNIWIWAIDFCSSWFGGKGNFKKTQIAFAWAMVPMIAGLILALIGYALFEEDLFTRETPNINGSQFFTIALWTYGILEIILGVWHIALIVVTLSQVQKLSIMKSIFSILLAFVLVMLPFFAIGLLMR
jgi:hypothetical protein